MKTFIKEHLIGILITVGFALTLTAGAIFGIPCLFRELTGVPCPGCGMSRAYRALFEFDLKSAFEYHPMFWSVPVFYVFFVTGFKPTKRKRLDAVLFAALLFLFILCYVLRLCGIIFNFNHI